MDSWLDELAFPESWQDLRGSALADNLRRDHLAAELRRELDPGHELSALSWRVIAVSAAADDALLALADGTAAIVHLTYTNKPPERPPWPATTFLHTSHELEGWLLSRR